MKNFLFFTITAFLFVCFFQVNAGSELNNNGKSVKINRSIALQYGVSRTVYGWGNNGTNSTLKAAVKFPESTMQKYVGNKITKIGLGTLDNVSYSELVVFITNSLDDTEYTYSETLTQNSGGWREVTLKTPFEITGQQLYIGYQLKSDKNPIGINSRIYTNDNDYVAINDLWKKASEYGLTGNLSLNATVEGSVFPEFDAVLRNVTIKDMALKGENIEIGGGIINYGTKSIKNFDLSYKINDQEEVTKTISLLVSAEMGTSASFSFPQKISLNKDGENTITISIKKVNGNDDLYPNDNTIIHKTIITDKIAHRKILLEHFTTESCPGCPAGHKYLENVVNNNPDIVWMAHHFGVGVDPYTSESSTKVGSFFGINGAPTAMLDRYNYYNQADPFLAAQNITKPMIDERLTLSSFVTVNIDGKFIAQDRSLNLTISGECFKEFPKETTKISIYLVEKGITTQNQSGASGTYTHAPVARFSITDAFGNDFNVDENGKYSYQYNYTVPSDWKEQNLSVVAFISKQDESKALCDIYNAQQVEFKNLGLTAIDKVNDINISIYPNPVKNYFTIEGGENVIDNVTIYDLSGKIIENINVSDLITTINTENFNSGIYFVKISGKGFQKTDKIVIKK